MVATLVVGGCVLGLLVLAVVTTRRRRYRDPYRALGTVPQHQMARPSGHERSRHEFED